MLAVYKKEFKSYFNSMLGYVYVAFIILFIGIYFSYYNLRTGYPYFGQVLSSILFVFLIAIPVLTMRSLAEERKTKTDQILFTSPISITKIVMGKYLAMVSIFAIPVVISCLCPIIISFLGTAYFLVDYSCILAFFLMGCAYIAIGMFISSITESQVLAAIGTFGILLILYLMSAISTFLPSTAFASLIGFYVVVIIIALIFYALSRNSFIGIGITVVGIIAFTIAYIVKSSMFAGLLNGFLNKLSLTAYFSNFVYDTFDITAIIYFLSIGFVFVFLTIQSIQKRRYS